MARARTSSPDITKANQRIIGMNGIAANLDLGDGVTTANLVAKRDRAKSVQDRYNAMLSELGALGLELDAAEKDLRAINSRVLNLVRGRYGADSAEYERVGGVRTSERKKPVRRAAPPA